MKTKNNIKRISRIQKPIDTDCHFKYRCPSSTCGYEHWISLKEAQTTNFKIVCDCGTVFKPKKIKTVKILYSKKKAQPQTKIVETVTPSPIIPEKIDVIVQEIPKALLAQTSKILIGYGFSKEESEKLLSETFRNSPIKDHTLLIKTALQNFGVNKNG